MNINTNKELHAIGQTISGLKIPLMPSRLADKSFKVEVGSDCTSCAFSGLGHVVCPELACQRSQRSDGTNIIYREVESGE